MKPHRPRKRFGQHFLQDLQVLDRIVAVIAPRPDQDLVEIGPGEGALTARLIERCDRLEVIELDRDLAASLDARLGEPPGLTIHQADALAVDFTALARGRTLRVVGNLPYNISTPLLFHLFEHSAVIGDMHFLLQKEVVDRLVAAPGSKQYGRLSVMTGLRASASLLFEVPPGAFRPPPKVDSAVVRLVPLPAGEKLLDALPMIDQVVRQAFSQRRKTLRNSLRQWFDEPGLKKLEIDPGLRPESLTPDAFVRLGQELGRRAA